MTLRFGTDGVRGAAGTELTPELALALGRAAARELGQPAGSFLVGRDTRRSGPLLAAALSAGLAAEGVDVIDLGVIPTPGVAALGAAYGVPGAVVSASHNPFADNGIKLFAAGGIKLTAQVEARVERDLHDPTGAPPAPLSGRALGTVGGDPEALGWYRRQVVASLEGRRLDGLRVVVDCGHGASVVTAVEVLQAAGAGVVEVIGDAPDGTNINAGCGSTDPSRLGAAVVRQGADAGLALDGDADRVIAVDAGGRVIDGDRLIALCALDLRRRGRLAADTVVVTVMTNLGFHLAMAREGIAVVQTAVGDRQVLEALDRGGWSLGGEQSGHLIFRQLATTGDGVLSGLQVLDVMARTGRSLADLAASAMDRLPQVLHNVTVVDLDGLAGATSVWAAVREVEAELHGEGRVLLRPSGTERLVRVMVEAPTEELAGRAASRLAAVVTDALGAPA
jgi:phosphoglucosamine mutase